MFIVTLQPNYLFWSTSNEMTKKWQSKKYKDRWKIELRYEFFVHISQSKVVIISFSFCRDKKKESTLTKKKLSAIENKHWISHSFLITVLNYSEKKCIQTHIWAFQTAQLNHSRKTEWKMFQLKITVVIFNIIKIIDASSVCNEPWKVHTNEIKTSILYL